MNAHRPETGAHAGGRPLLWIALILAGFLAAGYLARPQGRRATETLRSSLRTTPDGAAAFARALRRFGRYAEPRHTPFADADPAPRAAALLAPVRHPTPREANALLAAVRAGATLLYVPPYRAGPRDVPTTTPLMDSLGLRFRARAATGEETFADALWGADPLADRLPEPIPTRDALALERAGDEDGGARESLMTMTDEDGVPWSAALRIRVGAGRVVALADAGPLANARVAQDPLAALALRAVLLHVDEGDTLFFGEFHQGVGGRDSPAKVAASFLVGSPLGRALLHLGATCLLALACLGVRFGAPLAVGAEADRERRSPLEHVRALSDLYRSANASRTAALLLVGQLARSGGARPPGSIPEALDWIETLRADADADAPLARIAEGLRRDPIDLKAVAAGVDDRLDVDRRAAA